MVPGKNHVRMDELSLLFGVMNVLLSVALLGVLVLGIKIARSLGSDLVTAVLYLRRASAKAAVAIVLGTGIVFLANCFALLAQELHQVAESIGLAVVLAGAAGFVVILRSATRKTPVVKLFLREVSE